MKKNSKPHWVVKLERMLERERNDPTFMDFKPLPPAKEAEETTKPKENA